MSTPAIIPVMDPVLECWVWERRASARLLRELQCICRPVDARHDKAVFWPAAVRDISNHGVGLVQLRRFEPGTELTIELLGAKRNHRKKLLARVIRVDCLPHGDWLLGCAFIRQPDSLEPDNTGDPPHAAPAANN
jgi:hypothetical protein